MKSIAIITSHAPSLLNFRAPLIVALVSKGFFVAALAPNHDPHTIAELKALGAEAVSYKMSRTGLNPLRDAIDTISLIGILRRLSPDIAFCYFIKPVIFGTVAAWLAGVPRRFAMIEGLGTVFTDTGEKPTFKRRLLRRGVASLYRIALSRACGVLVLNRDDFSDLRNRFSIPERKIHLLGAIGVDLDAWRDAPSVNSPLVFLFAARLLREKGVLQFVDAARALKKSAPSARFILLGGLDLGHASISLEEVKVWVSEGVVEWPGHAPMRPWLAQASVFVLPSYYREGVPRTIQEAMAMGRPVITSDSPGCRDSVIDGVNGFLVPVRDVDALVSKMKSFVDSPDLVESMGRAAREFAVSKFDVNEVNSRLLRILL